MLGVEIDHVLVAVHLTRVVEDGGHVDVFVGDGATAGMLDARAGLEILEIAVRTRKMSQLAEFGTGLIGWKPQLAGDLIRLVLEAADLGRLVSLVDLDLALPGRDDGFAGVADILARGRLNVDDSEIGSTRRWADAEYLRFDLDGVADVHGCAESHVDVFEIRAGIL